MTTAVARLLDHHVRVGERGDLREVRDNKHLMRARERRESLTDGECGLPANTSVNLVKDECVARVH